MSDLGEFWFKKAMMELSAGEEVLLQVNSKEQQTEVKNMILEAKERYLLIEPIQAHSLTVHTAKKGIDFWVAIKRRPPTLTVGFIRKQDGQLIKVEAPQNSDTQRAVKLMIQDGMSKEMILAEFSESEQDEVRELLDGY